MFILNKGAFLIIGCSLAFGIGIAHSDENKSLSTSGFIEVEYFNDTGAKVKTCSQKKAAFAQSYVSIGINKLTVNKDDSLLKRIFDSDRHAFGASNLKATYQGQPLSISRVGPPIILSGGDSSVDMGVEWGMLDRIPWVLKNANIEIKLGYAANSTTKAIIDAFSGITSTIPDYTISTSLATGFAITTAIDNLLFGSGRAIDLLHAERDLPLLAGQLCEGHYAIFSAENNLIYEKYYHGKVVWTGKDLEFNDKPIDDVSYAVVGVKVSDRYYSNVKNSLNDNSRAWSGKYREVQTSLFDLIWVSNTNELDAKRKSIRSNLLAARTLLTADINLIQEEKQEIHLYVLSDFKNRLDIAENRINSKNKITKASTAAALLSGLNSESVVLDSVSATMAERILLDSDNNLPSIKSNLAPAYLNAISEIRNVISIH
jgi:hypothetical protein